MPPQGSSSSSISSSLATWIDLAALTTSAAFAGVALHISLVEHPARMRICKGGSPKDALVKWKQGYDRAAPIQASLATATTVLGGLGAWLDRRPAGHKGGDRAWWLAAGCLLVGSNVPLTMLCVMPLNDRLQLRAARALEQEAGMGGDKAKADAAAASEEAAENDDEVQCTPTLCFGSFALKGLPSTTALLRAWGYAHSIRTLLGCAGFGVLAFQAVAARQGRRG